MSVQGHFNQLIKESLGYDALSLLIEFAVVSKILFPKLDGALIRVWEVKALVAIK